MYMYLLPVGSQRSVWLGTRCVWLDHGGCSRADREAVSPSSAQRRWPWCCPGDQSRGQCQPALSGENQLVASHPTGMCIIYSAHDEYIMVNVLLHIHVHVHIQCVSVLITILEHHIILSHCTCTCTCTCMYILYYMHAFLYVILCWQILKQMVVRVISWGCTK